MQRRHDTDMKGHTVRFQINGVYNQSDPFRDRQNAEEYAEKISRRGDIEATNVARTTVDRKAHFVEE